MNTTTAQTTRRISLETTINALQDAGIRVWTKAGADDARIYDPRRRGGYLVLEQVYAGDLSYYQAEVGSKCTGAFRAQVARVLDELEQAHR